MTDLPTFRIGDRVNLPRWTDVVPGTVVNVKRKGREVHVRVDNAELAQGEKPEIITGGFAGHCTNQSELKWDITENPDGHIEIFTVRKWRGKFVWTPKGCSPDGRNRVVHGWRKFYDYNF